MKREEFIRLCGVSMLALPFAGSLLTACQSIYYATSTQDDGNLVVPLSEFLRSDNPDSYRDFVLVQTELGFPICVWRFSETKYTAALMQCTHRGCELNVGGGMYSCPCHGSEFDTHGKVLEGPADRDLKTFKTTIENEKLYITLS